MVNKLRSIWEESNTSTTYCKKDKGDKFNFSSELKPETSAFIFSFFQ